MAQPIRKNIVFFIFCGVEIAYFVVAKVEINIGKNRRLYAFCETQIDECPIFIGQSPFPRMPISDVPTLQLPIPSFLFEGCIIGGCNHDICNYLFHFPSHFLQNRHSFWLFFGTSYPTNENERKMTAQEYRKTRRTNSKYTNLLQKHRETVFSTRDFHKK